MCADMIDLQKAKTRIIELEEELKSTRDEYEEEIATLLEKNDDLIKKIGVFMGDPVPGGEDDDSTCLESYIIIDDTDSDPSDDDFEDEAGADIMESSTDQNFQMTTKYQWYSPMYIVVVEHFYDSSRPFVCPCLID